ncbi:MAG: L-threonylcarbamoyladenylate synthase [Actinomycetota bacterium]
MPSVFELTGPDEVPLAAATEALARGELVVLPTDTVYGVAARPDLAGATARLFEAKRRPRGLTLPVLASDLGQADDVGRFDQRARTLAGRFWPGALTLILPRGAASAAWDLGAERATVALRVPDQAVARSLLRRTGPLAATSANLSGRPTPEECGGVREALGDAVAVYLCSGRLSPIPSTIVDLTGSEARMVRDGAVSPEEVLAALR